jgi:tetratricopeptide (TPR) repeat protein
MSKQRINLAPGPAGERVVLGKKQKSALEAAYGHKLSPDLWRKIIAVTNELTVDGPLGSTAAFYDEALKKLHKLAKLARALRDDVDPRKAGMAELTLEEIWYAHFHRRKTPPSNRAFFKFMLEIIEPVIALDNFAKKCKADPTFGEVPKGTDARFYWEYWIIALSTLFERHGLPVGARKDVDKMKPGKESKFVLFVAQLQKYCPVKSRHFTDSYDDLAQAIQRVRASYKSEIKRETLKEAEAAAQQLQRAAEKEQRKLDKAADAVKWRLRDTRAALNATLEANATDAKAEEDIELSEAAEVDMELSEAEERAEEDMELCLASNEVVDLIREGRLDAAEQAAEDLLDRFPEAHDGYDRLGMVHEARSNKQQAAECYRKVIEVVRRHPEHYESGFEKTFAELVKRLDPPANHTERSS